MTPIVGVNRTRTHAGVAVAGYRAEMRHIEEALAEFGETDAFAEPINARQVTQYLYCHYRRASLAGDPALLAAVDRAIDRALPLLTHAGDLYLLKASVALKLHKLADVEAAFLAIPSIATGGEGRLIRADLDFQRGRYGEAERGYREAVETERSWSALARLAHFHTKMGDARDADRLYCEAEDELTAKEMRSYAWLEVQRGFLAFSAGAYDKARSHYDRAEAAYPGYWLVHEYLAELLGAEGRYQEAIEIFEGLASAGSRPDLQQATAELCEIAGQTDRAAHWQEQALTGYLQSVQQGEVHYLHHLADYYSEVAKDGTEAVAWARADLRLRENFSTQAALARAFYRNEQHGEACMWIERALGSGALEAHLFSGAARIYAAVGDAALARNCMERATSLNPCVEKFHVHH